MVTGFKTFLPGSTVKYNLKPDLTTWGKGLANGYSFCALTGTKNVMELGGLEQKHSPRVFSNIVYSWSRNWTVTRFWQL